MDTLSESPAAERNKQPILEVLQRLLPPQGRALELASGTGQHAAWLGAGLPGWTWQPTEYDETALPTIAARVQRSGVGNVLPPRRLDVSADTWPSDADPSARAFEQPFDAIFCANLLHIAPWSVCDPLMRGAQRHLAADGCLLLYGPFLEGDVPTAESNLAFDASLKRQHPDWGIRQRESVERSALAAGLRLRQRVTLPSNNLLLVFRPA